MAEQDSRQTTDIVRQLITSVKQLSDQMASGSQPRSVDNEISQVFGRSRATNAGPSSTTSTSSGIGVGGNSSCASQAGGLSHFRRLSNQRRIGSNVNKRTKKARLPDSSPFLCDLVLLNGPTTNVVPRQGARVTLMEHGHMLSACRFTKAMTEIDVELTIIEAFGDKIPRLVDVEILTSVHSKLVKPTLAPGQEGINGVILHRLFKTKPIYVRPSQQLLPSFMQEDEEAEDEEREQEKSGTCKNRLTYFTVGLVSRF